MRNYLFDKVQAIPTWSHQELQREYQEELRYLNHPKDPSDDKKLSLDELLADFEKEKIQEGKKEFDLDALIALLDAKIEELERENNIENSSNLDDNDLDEPVKVIIKDSDANSFRIQDYVPQKGFSALYHYEFAKIFVSHLISNQLDAVEVLHPATTLPDYRFSRILYEITNSVSYIVEKEQLLSFGQNRITHGISTQIKEFIQEEIYTKDSLYTLLFYQYAYFVLLSLQEKTANNSAEVKCSEAKRFIFYVIANSLYLRDPHTSAGLPWAKKGIMLSEPSLRQDAFNILGLCALHEKNGKQLAYDVYLSWIQQTPVGLMSELLAEDFTFGKYEDEWRRNQKNGNEVATMYNNYAYTCASIAETYELNTPERKRFQRIALKYMQKAIEKDPDYRYLISISLILEDSLSPDKSPEALLVLIRKAVENSSLRKRPATVQLYCNALIDQILSMLLNSKQHFSEWYKQNESFVSQNLFRYIHAYREMQTSPKEKDESDEIINHWNDFIVLQEKMQSRGESDLALALLLVGQLSWNIKRYLRRNSYTSVNFYTRDKKMDANVSARREQGKPIAYYTTLKTAMYLFNVMYRNKPNTAPKVVQKGDPGFDQGYNCLTMMQTYYMNDPYEGLSFAKGISGKNAYDNILFYRGNAWKYREELFQKNFIFLKSFTDRIDNLLMWNRYGSDRYSGSHDSNGCCIRFDSEFFSHVNDRDVAYSDRNMLADKEDDYKLYRVVYINQNGKIENSKNPGLNRNVKNCYDQLIEILQYINYQLSKIIEVNPNDKLVSQIRRYVQATLGTVIFLFKDDEYADEREYRLVVERSYKELDKICMLPGEPQKACINPYFQVCIDKVVLGPNVENPEHWFNHFRFHIAAMWHRALGEGAEIPDFVVEKSNIHYHT